MSTWRKKAIEIAPELRKKFEDPDLELFSVFSELLTILENSFKNKDIEKVEQIFNYAEWCFRQKEEKLWNAVGVSFYEHLGDQTETFSNFTNWVKLDIYLEIRALLQVSIKKEKLETLDKFYNWKP
jgi:hypothetical protein